MGENNTHNINYLFLIWLVLFMAKVTGNISWDWWIIFIPLCPIGLILSAMFVVSIFLIILFIFCLIGRLVIELYESITDY